MHVLLVTHYALPHQGGIEFVVDHLIQRLVTRGCQVTLLTSDIASDEITPQGWAHIRLPELNFLENYAIPFPIFNPLRLARTLNRLLPEIDVVHAHGLLYQDCVTATWMACHRGIPVLLTEHVGLIEYNSRLVNGVEKLAFNTLGRICCRQSDCVTVLNQRVESEIKPLVRSGTPIETVTNGVDTQRFHPPTLAEKAALREKWGLTPDRPAVLFVGRLVEKKGIHLLTGAISDAFDLVIAGRGSLPATHPNIKLIGAVSQDTLVELYQACDAFAMPSEGEGFPLAVQEALACGLPIIVTDNPVNREYLDAATAIFTARTVEAVRSAIHDLLSDEPRRSAMADAARELAVSRFDWEQTTTHYLSLYQQLIEQAQSTKEPHA